MNTQRFALDNSRVTGWVKNMPDGRVEALAEGRRRQLDRFVSWCRQGPPAADVTHVEASWFEPTGDLESFHVRR